ncbi:hypothetical protein GQ37_005725 [Janthinobacterium sp. BJB1]|nr:hypothetical protein GQ37_005725 [Janthinobacterium sp. BJB1]
MSIQTVFLKLPSDWSIRVARASQLSSEGAECPVCGGTGGWPGLQKFVVCKPCGGLGVACDEMSHPAPEK